MNIHFDPVMAAINMQKHAAHFAGAKIFLLDQIALTIMLNANLLSFSRIQAESKRMGYQTMM